MNINPVSRHMIGDKIKIMKVLNKEIIVHGYKLEESKFKGKCLHMQIEMNEEKYVIFSGSSVLIETIQQVKNEDFPFATTIVKEDERLKFT